MGTPNSVQVGSITSPVRVCYNTSSKTFVASETEIVWDITSAHYYTDFTGMENYGTVTYNDDNIATAVTPVKDKIYVNTSTNEMYRWDGSDMIKVNNYVLPTASSDALGGIKTGYTSTNNNFAV